MIAVDKVANWVVSENAFKLHRCPEVFDVEGYGAFVSADAERSPLEFSNDRHTCLAPYQMPKHKHSVRLHKVAILKHVFPACVPCVFKAQMCEPSATKQSVHFIMSRVFQENNCLINACGPIKRCAI
jgi:hypothetical protein